MTKTEETVLWRYDFDLSGTGDPEEEGRKALSTLFKAMAHLLDEGILPDFQAVIVQLEKHSWRYNERLVLKLIESKAQP